MVWIKKLLKNFGRKPKYTIGDIAFDDGKVAIDGKGYPFKKVKFRVIKSKEETIARIVCMPKHRFFFKGAEKFIPSEVPEGSHRHEHEPAADMGSGDISDYIGWPPKTLDEIPEEFFGE